MSEIKEILDDLRKTADNTIFVVCSSQEELDKMPRYTANFLSINDRKAKILLDYITNLQEENTIKDTNWESLKYYLEKLYYKDYIEEAISDDIDKKIKELESKVEIKGYQKDIKTLQEENKELKELEHDYRVELKLTARYEKRIEKAIEYIKEHQRKDEFLNLNEWQTRDLLNILQGE